MGISVFFIDFCVLILRMKIRIGVNWEGIWQITSGYTYTVTELLTSGQHPRAFLLNMILVGPGIRTRTTVISVIFTQMTELSTECPSVESILKTADEEKVDLVTWKLQEIDFSTLLWIFLWPVRHVDDCSVKVQLSLSTGSNRYTQVCSLFRNINWMYKTVHETIYKRWLKWQRGRVL